MAKIQWTQDVKQNQDMILRFAAAVLSDILERYKWGTEYRWRLRGAIKLLLNPPKVNRGMRG